MKKNTDFSKLSIAQIAADKELSIQFIKYLDDLNRKDIEKAWKKKVEAIENQIKINTKVLQLVDRTNIPPKKEGELKKLYLEMSQYPPLAQQRRLNLLLKIAIGTDEYDNVDNCIRVMKTNLMDLKSRYNIDEKLDSILGKIQFYNGKYGNKSNIRRQEQNKRYEKYLKLFSQFTTHANLINIFETELDTLMYAHENLFGHQDITEIKTIHETVQRLLHLDQRVKTEYPNHYDTYNQLIMGLIQIPSLLAKLQPTTSKDGTQITFHQKQVIEASDHFKIIIPDYYSFLTELKKTQKINTSKS